MTTDKSREALTDIANYYSEKLKKHGCSAGGVDWKDESSQLLRFEQLCRVIETRDQYSLNDLGCGYGAMFEYLKQCSSSFTYCGVDISPAMINSARAHYGDCENAHFELADKPGQLADYSVASGIFNVRLDCEDSEWLGHIEDTLDVLDSSSSRGFAFNCLTSYCDADKMRDYLYYASPEHMFTLCKKRYSKNVALLHDYALYEFTIVVRKDLP